jgi:hypothetical protein
MWMALASCWLSRVGHATVAGVPTTGYRAQVDLHKVAARAQAREGAKAAQAIQQETKAMGTATGPVDVWIDAHHLARQIRYQTPILAAGTSGSGKGVLSMTFTSFGGPAHLTPPPAS